MAYDLARKRPYQPTLAAYFAHSRRAPESTRDDLSPRYDHLTRYTGSCDHQEAIDTSGTRSLPHHVQASLLNVGMRVRKAVQEGYRTQSQANVISYMHPRSFPTKNAGLPQPQYVVGELSADFSTNESDLNDKENWYCGLKRKQIEADDSELNQPASTSESMDVDQTPGNSVLSPLAHSRPLARAKSKPHNHKLIRNLQTQLLQNPHRKNLENSPGRQLIPGWNHDADFEEADFLRDVES